MTRFVTTAKPVEIGTRCGKLVVLSRVARRGSHTYLQCQCDCGTIKSVKETYVRNERVKSCGCAKVENMRHLAEKYCKPHGGITIDFPKEHASWNNMKARCSKPSNKDWANYGGRGIAVCARWMKSFEAFIADMGPKPTPAHQIERKNVNGDYEPGNCIWATSHQQRRNKRNNLWVELNGQRMIMADAARTLGISGPTLKARIQRGWPESDWGLPVGAKRQAG